ncbi:MAG: signal recognition particle-docking protein FtsY [Actinomycetota bacterium]|nr:signal recognition particle-docking protein FtsY [Actinomycetota bacterium]
MRKLIKNFNYFVNKLKNNDQDVWEELEEELILGDINAATAAFLLEEIKTAVLSEKIISPDRVKELLKQKIEDILNAQSVEGLKDPDYIPAVYLIIGVNGVGKTTTLAKIARLLQRDGKTVLIAAADTYRAAAVEQIEHHAQAIGIPVVSHQRNSDPGAVVYDSIEKAIANQIDVVLIDTAGRMQTSYNLMEELKKVSRVVNKKLGRDPDEVLLVLDSTTGQNAKTQAEIFNQALKVTGLVLTKTDGTSKGGIAVTIKHELGLGVKLIGSGEKLDDLSYFDPKKYVDLLIS